MLSSVHGVPFAILWLAWLTYWFFAAVEEKRTQALPALRSFDVERRKKPIGEPHQPENGERHAMNRREHARSEYYTSIATGVSNSALIAAKSWAPSAPSTTR